MALNIKDPETERPAREIAGMTGESKTGAIRTALRERKERLELRTGHADRASRLRKLLEEEIWPSLPPERARACAVARGAGRDPRLRPARRVILDTSAILAILFDEVEGDVFLEQIGSAPAVGVGAPTLVETGLVLAGRLGEEALPRLRRFVEQGGVALVPFEQPHWEAAVEAWLRFGRGRHEAALNLGDCLAYATARVAGKPLLFRGARTSPRPTWPAPERAQLARILIPEGTSRLLPLGLEEPPQGLLSRIAA